MSAAIPPIEEMTEAQRDEMLGRLVMDAFRRRGVGTIPVRLADTSVALVVPRFEPAAVTTIPDFPPEFLEEIERRAATPEDVLDWEEFRELLAQDLQRLADEEARQG